MSQHKIYIIVAADENNGIGKDGQLPWKFKRELKYFQKTTTETNDPDKQNMVIMGRSTWEALGEKFSPLPKRKNIVLTKQKNYHAKGAEVAHSIDDALSKVDDKIEKIFILGGGKVFKDMINHPKLEGIYLTRIFHKYDCDTFFPSLPPQYSQIRELGTDKEKGIEFDYLLYKKPRIDKNKK